MTEREFVQMLIRRGLVTTDPAEADKCCGLPRDEDGFCTYRPHHPIYYAEPGFEFDEDDDEPLEVKYAAGNRVRFTHPDAGYPGEQQHTAEHLTLGEVYTIATPLIGQSRTDLILKGIPNVLFNSVFFEAVTDGRP